MEIWNIPQIKVLEAQKKIDNEPVFSCVYTFNFN